MFSILLVDDDYDGSVALAAYLRRGGYEVRHVHNGRDALAAATESLPDLVILDLRMPGMTGMEFLSVLRSYHRLASVRVVLLSGYLSQENEDRISRLDVKKVFDKGIDGPAEIRAWIDQQFILLQQVGKTNWAHE